VLRWAQRQSSGSWAGSLTGTKHTATEVQMRPPNNIRSSAVAKDETVDGRSLKSSAIFFTLLRTKNFFSKVVAKMNFSFPFVGYESFLDH